MPRIAPNKPAKTVVAPTDDREELILKFAEGSGIRLREGRFVLPADAGPGPAFTGYTPRLPSIHLAELGHGA